VVEGVKNTETFQPINFGMRNGSIKDIYFFQDNGYIMKYEIARRQKTEHKLFDVLPN
jgi:uncharacterized protein YrrD